MLANPSRLDTVSLLSGNGGQMFNAHCLRPELNIMQCDVRLAEDKEPLLPNTKVVLLLGEAAMHEQLKETESNTIGEMRGSIFERGGIYYIPSFFPQDATDIKNFEAEHNPLSKEYQHEDADDDDEYAGDAKRHGRTSRRNFAFWLRRDVWKAKQLLKEGRIPNTYPQPQYIICPSPDAVFSSLANTVGQTLYFDIETDFEEQNLQCFAYTFDGKTVYSVPILDYNYKPVPGFHRTLFALGKAFRDNQVVAHNGATFDFFVMAWKYGICVKKPYDTMLAMHRCFPDVERSLGHCTSYWTWEKFHKDEDSLGYMTATQMRQRLEYCGKDVFTMFIIHKEIEKYARTIPGLTDSIDSAMRCIRPYLTTSLQGIRYDEALVAKKRYDNDRLMEQYLRIIRLLIGPNGIKDVMGTSKSNAFPASNPQCVRYFHDILGYPVVARGKQRVDGTRHPSLAANAMYKLRLANENPVIDFSIAYRQVALETKTPLGFIPFRDNENKIIDIRKYGQATAEHNNGQGPLPSQSAAQTVSPSQSESEDVDGSSEV